MRERLKRGKKEIRPFVVYLPVSLHRELRIVAVRKGKSMSSTVVEAVEHYLKRRRR